MNCQEVPEPKYWQQRTEYVIEVALDDEKEATTIAQQRNKKTDYLVNHISELESFYGFCEKRTP